MHRINLRKNANAFDPRNLHPVPKQPALDFPYPDFDAPQNQLLVHHLIKHPLPNLYNSSPHQEDNNSLYTSSLHQEDTLFD